MILHELIDYETLRLIWWLLLGVLLIAFATTGGFDLGVGTLLPLLPGPIRNGAWRSTPSAPPGRATRSG